MYHEKHVDGNYSIEHFEEEITSMTSFYPILRSFIRYSSQVSDREYLATVTVKKLHELGEL